MATIVVQYALRFDRKNEISDTDKTSKGLVQLEIYFDRKRIYKSTGFRLTRSEWDYKKNRPKDPILNRKLETIISEFRAFEDEFRAKNKTFALTDFQYKDKPAPKVEPIIKQTSFTDWFWQHLQAKKVKAQSSWGTRRLSFDYFKKFKENVRFDEINFSLIESYDFFLHSGKATGKKLHTNTIKLHHKNLKLYIKTAIQYQLLPSNYNPYNDF